MFPWISLAMLFLPSKEKKMLSSKRVSVSKAIFISSPASPSEFLDSDSLPRHHPFSKTDCGRRRPVQQDPAPGLYWCKQSGLSQPYRARQWLPGTDQQPHREKGLRTRSCSSPAGLSPFLLWLCHLRRSHWVFTSGFMPFPPCHLAEM